MALDGFGRFSEVGLLILTCLLDGQPKHGYALAAELREHYERHVGPGSLYGALARLEEAGLIEPVSVEGRRRPYRLTQQGLTVATAEIQALERITAYARRRLRLRGATS